MPTLPSHLPFAAILVTCTATLAAQVITASGVTGVCFARAGGTTTTVPAGTPLAGIPVSATASLTTGGIVYAGTSSSLAATEPFRLTTSANGYSQVTQGLSAPEAAATGEVVTTLQATEPVWGEVAVSWSTSGTSNNIWGAMAMVDVGDDGIAEVLLMHFGIPAQAAFPVAFGPGPLRIRTSVRLQNVRGNMEQYVDTLNAQLQVELRPDPSWVAITSTPAACTGLAYPSLGANVDYLHRLRFRVTGVLPGLADFGVLVLGATAATNPLPLPSTCQLLTDPFHVRLLSPAELTGTPVVCAAHGLPAPFTLHVQAVTVSPQPVSLWTSNRLTIAR